MIHRKLFAVCMVAGLTAAGCSSVKVIRSPDVNDTGVRFYRPKPYLLVTPADPTGRMVNLKLEYLPDYNEEYSAHIRGKTSVALKDGWNLVGVNTKEAPPAEKESPAPAPAPPPLPAAVVAATNVPIGYYESVYEYTGAQKYFKGWKYIGFTVLGPTKPGICHKAEHADPCGKAGGECIEGPLYGMVFFNGVMTFRQLDEIANNQLCPTFVNPAPGSTTPAADTGSRLVPVAPAPAPESTVEPIKPEKPAATLESLPPAPTPSPNVPPAPPGASNARPRPRATRSVVGNLPPLPPGF